MAEPTEFDFRRELVDSIPPLRAFARSLARDKDLADDLTHAALERALTFSHQFTPGTNFRAWLFTIARHQFYNESKKWRNRTVTIENETDSLAPIDGNQEITVEIRDFRRAFWALAPAQREILVLIGANGISYEEAADICGCATGTVKSRLSRARRELKRLMDGETGRSENTSAIEPARHAFPR